MQRTTFTSLEGCKSSSPWRRLCKLHQRGLPFSVASRKSFEQRASQEHSQVAASESGGGDGRREEERGKELRPLQATDFYSRPLGS
jgi:hypothetical protein